VHSPRHWMPFKSRNEGAKCVGCRSGQYLPGHTVMAPCQLSTPSSANAAGGVACTSSATPHPSRSCPMRESASVSAQEELPTFRGLHSFTFQLNFSALYGIGGARRGCTARVRGV